MRSNALKSSLINRIIVVSRKPHGTVTRRLKVNKCSVLPVVSTEVASDAVDFLSCHPWPQHCVWHAVSSLAASQCLQIVSHYQLAKLHELVTVARSEDGENGEEGWGEDGGEGDKRKGRVQEKASMKGWEGVEQTSMSEGKRLGRREEEEGAIGGTRERVACLSALVPVLASVPSLQHIAHSALCEVMVSRMGLSPECEQSLLHLCGDNPENLARLTKLARNHGHRFSRLFYRGALSSVMKQHTREAEGGGGVQEAAPTVAAELLAMMSGDWDKAVVEADIFWLSLHLARDKNQVQVIYEDMCNSQPMPDESVSVELVSACLRTADTLEHSNPRHCQADPSHAVSTLVSHLPSQQASLSAAAFEKVLIACADTLQMRKAYETFMCMALTHGLAPTRAVLQALGRLLCSPDVTANYHWRRYRLAFAFRMLEVSVDSFGGAAPGWVYAECARPFTELLGARGYTLTYELCQAATIRDHGDDTTVVMSEVWDRHLYHALLQSCQVNHGPELATFLLNHMTCRGILPNEHTFHHLLQFPISQSNRDDFMAVLARHVHTLSSEEIANLKQPLHSVFRSTLPHTALQFVSDGVVDSTVNNAVEQFLEVASSHITEEQCVSHLASLAGVSLPSSDQTCGDSSTHRDTGSECDHMHGIRATA